jgi:hypothetical protein
MAVVARAYVRSGGRRYRSFGRVQRTSPLCRSRFIGDGVLAAALPAAAGSPMNRLLQREAAAIRCGGRSGTSVGADSSAMGACGSLARWRGIADESAPTRSGGCDSVRGRSGSSVGADSSAMGACDSPARCRGIADESAPTKRGSCDSVRGPIQLSCRSRFIGDGVLAAARPAAAGSPMNRLLQRAAAAIRCGADPALL